MNSETNLLLIFLTGLTTGGLSCLAIQGGLLASVISPAEKQVETKLKKENTAVPLLSFLVSKLIAYTILGALLGFVGSFISLTPQFRGWLQVIIGIYLAGVALSLIDAHPIFRYFVIKPPKFLSRLLRNQAKSQSIFAPALLGAMTVFLPCAVTQAMEVVALGTANPLLSAAIMFAFTLGTSPTFFLIGFIFSKLGEKFQGMFYKLSFVVLIFLAVLTINGGVSLMGSIYTLQNFMEAAGINYFNKAPRIAGLATKDSEGVQEVELIVSSSGYSPQNITIRNGVRTRLVLKTNGTGGCARAFTIPSLRISKILPATGTSTLEFTPTRTGPLVFTCSMGMYTGVFNVI